MFDKILIANRGEIACRIVRTARRLGVRTVLAVSEADQQSLAADMADEVVLIGPARASESYLRIDRIIEAAKRTGCQAIHPGYGFLAENADFAEATGRAGLAFIGPSPQAMRALGAKSSAKSLAEKQGIPVVPGYQGDKQDLGTLKSEAKEVGYPLLIKAVAGGGGRGMRLVERDVDFADALASAQREAEGAFGDRRVLIERLIERPRHVEIQVFGDSHGNVVHLYERDCSLQRRNQKVIEEAPAPGMSEGLREKMTSAAVRLAKAVRYEGAGTVEFLVEGGSLEPDAAWHFIEMNTRLQVEHPVTEEITGLDLVEWQLRVAAGAPLPLTQDAIRISGHAIEARLCAEDVRNEFAPSTGRLVAFSLQASDIRVETGVRAGDEVSPFYDSMIAKLISSGSNREEAVAGLLDALDGLHVAGPRTNAAFLRALLSHPDVTGGRLDTGLINRSIEVLAARRVSEAAVASGIRRMLEEKVPSRQTTSGPWDCCDAFQLGGVRRQAVSVVVDGVPMDREVLWVQDGPVVANAGDAGGMRLAGTADRLFVQDGLMQAELTWPSYDAAGSEEPGNESVVRAPINGRVAKIFVAAGQHIDRGQRVAVIEAMKMEHVLSSPRAGVVERIAVKEGQQVTAGLVVAALGEEQG